MMWGHWSWSYWQDEENKPKQETKPNYCDHAWLEKPLFNHVHKMCDKCGILYTEWLNEKTIEKDMYYD